MMSRAIYYPYIRVPDSAWFTRTLLYWDQVGAIVPYDYIENPELLGHHMVGLVRENLVVQIVPGMHLWKVPRFAEAFLEHLDRRDSSRKPSKGVSSGHWTRIHMEKLEGVADALCRRGLARKDDTAPHSPWYQIQPDTADEFMAYLSAVLGQIPGDDQFAPVTDQLGQLSRFRPRTLAVGRRGPIREVVLRGLLPSPSGGIEPRRLAEFKAEHHGALRDFRQGIENRVSQWALIEDDEDRTLAVEEGVRQLQEQMNDIAARMKREGWFHLDFGGLCAIVGSGVAGWSAVKAGDLGLGLAGAALSLAPAVYDAFRGAGRELGTGPLTYAVLAENHL